jgi:hypothetical protein
VRVTFAKYSSPGMYIKLAKNNKERWKVIRRLITIIALGVWDWGQSIN